MFQKNKTQETTENGSVEGTAHLREIMKASIRDHRHVSKPSQKEETAKISYVRQVHPIRPSTIAKIRPEDVLPDGRLDAILSFQRLEKQGTVKKKFPVAIGMTQRIRVRPNLNGRGFADL
ncbi:hypothetical protein AAG570_010685 [Ranatra chinensis]|uniref:Uncharacterized protein n=1 Tax=Ranatra chinensis TaxID=642074 RepID=A0ABD0Z5C6_9HEMI